ncbi:MAG: pyridoxal-dependent decarboxylase, exosortase A system-associated [Candidatus Polarisedimenticolaceae bacterium]|nr:pyridoxal-dependent decarboxylase, exosortase A system-associated [Candidatus Polarisedimenticolaceae bacterium]
MNQFPIMDGELYIGGVPITQLAERAGQTPFYAYDRKLITERVENLRHSLPEEIHIHYAIKANPMPAIVQHLAGLVDGFDLASAGEMKTALDTTMPATKISVAGPGKTDKELRQAIAAGITINLESEGEMRRTAQVGEVLGIAPRVAVRVNPDYDLKSSGMKMGGGPKQFGVDAERVPAMLKELGQLGLKFFGFHIFWGSQNLNPEAIMEAHEKTFNLAIRLSEQAPDTVQSLNIGGGLGIPYFPGEKRLDLAPIGENLNKLLPSLKAELPEAEIVTELGRYLVGEAGIYICKIIDIKESRGEKFLITDGGLHHHLAASGNFGQIIRKNYPVTIANKMESTILEMVNVVGLLCTPLDILANKMELPQAGIGDLVAIYQSGAYGYTASPEHFLSHPSCMELIV